MSYGGGIDGDATSVSLLWYPLSPTTSVMPAPAGRTASTCSAAVMSVSTIVVVSPLSAACTVTPTTAPVSRSTACGRARAAVLHLRDLRVWILRVRPIVVRPLLLAPPVEPGQFRTSRGGDTGRLGEPGQPRLASPVSRLASPRWLRVSSRRSQWCAPPPGERPPAAATPTSPLGASRRRSGGACATASNGPATPRAARSPGTAGCSANRPRFSGSTRWATGSGRHETTARIPAAGLYGIRDRLRLAVQ